MWQILHVAPNILSANKFFMTNTNVTRFLLELLRIELRTSRMQSERSTTELQPHFTIPNAVEGPELHRQEITFNFFAVRLQYPDILHWF